MNFVVIETFGGAEYAVVVSDENGQNKVFNERADVEAEAADCQDGIIVEL